MHRKRDDVVSGEPSSIQDLVAAKFDSRREQSRSASGLERQRNFEIGANRRAIEREEIVVVLQSADRKTADVGQAVRDYQLGPTFSETDRLGICVPVARATVIDSLRERNRTGATFGRPIPGIDNRIPVVGTVCS